MLPGVRLGGDSGMARRFWTEAQREPAPSDRDLEASGEDARRNCEMGRREWLRSDGRASGQAVARRRVYRNHREEAARLNEALSGADPQRHQTRVSSTHGHFLQLPDAIRV